MWGGAPQNWGGFPIQQASFANVPHDQVDWASLAKQWIATKEHEPENAQNGQQRSMSHGLPTTHLGPPGTQPGLPGMQPGPPGIQPGPPGVISGPPPHTMATASFSQPPPPFNPSQPPPSATQAAQGQGWGGWGWGHPGWAATPPPPPASQDEEEKKPEIQQFNYGHGYSGYGEESVDYSEGAYETVYADSYWQSGDAEKEFSGTEGYAAHYRDAKPDDAMMSGIDAAKRRTLPAWIREGLEKMENAKRKQQEHEQRLREAEEKKRQRQEEERKTAEEMQTEVGENGLPIVRKSRFDDSDEEVSDGEKTEDKEEAQRPEAIAAEPELTEEEKQAQLMMKVRRMMTEVLIDVTTEQMQLIAQEVYYKEKSRAAKAPARQIAKSTALASITSLGLGYGSDSDEETEQSSAENEEYGSISDSSEGELLERSLKKRAEFEKKMREIEEIEREQERRKKESVQEDIFPNESHYDPNPREDSHRRESHDKLPSIKEHRIVLIPKKPSKHDADSGSESDSSTGSSSSGSSSSSSSDSSSENKIPSKARLLGKGDASDRKHGDGGSEFRRESRDSNHSRQDKRRQSKEHTKSDRKHDKDRSKHASRSQSRDRYRPGSHDRHTSRLRDRHRSQSRDRRRSRDRHRSRSHERRRSRDKRSRSKDRRRSRDRYRSRSHDRHRSRSQSYERARHFNKNDDGKRHSHHISSLDDSGRYSNLKEKSIDNGSSLKKKKRQKDSELDEHRYKSDSKSKKSKKRKHSHSSSDSDDESLQFSKKGQSRRHSDSSSDEQSSPRHHKNSKRHSHEDVGRERSGKKASNKHRNRSQIRSPSP